jgi:hypothetical protein
MLNIYCTVFAYIYMQVHICIRICSIYYLMYIFECLFSYEKGTMMNTKADAK